jgi:predicted GNAT family N-acyltransferase
VILAAQVTAEPFYAAHGYGPVGAHFEEAGIEHVRMEKPL